MVRIRRARFPNYDCMVISAKWISEKKTGAFSVSRTFTWIGEKPPCLIPSNGKMHHGTRDSIRDAYQSWRVGLRTYMYTHAALNLALAEVREA